jgi:hypothetical protein
MELYSGGNDREQSIQIDIVFSNRILAHKRIFSQINATGIEDDRK